MPERNSRRMPMSLELQRLDEQARAHALDTTRSFLVQAPAGSGKTTVLTCRLLALLGQASQPEEILAITFTRKAAAEMRTRALQALQDAAAGRVRQGRETEAPLAVVALRRDRELGWRLLDNPARLRILTIDAFCQGIASQLPVAARAGLQWRVAIPARHLYAAAARRVLERALRESELRAVAQLLFQRLDNHWERLEDLLILMLEERAHWLPRVLSADHADLSGSVAQNLQRLIRQQLEALAALMPSALLEEGLEFSRRAAGRLAADGGSAAAADAGALSWPAVHSALGVEPVQLPSWRFLCAMALKANGDWRSKWDKRNGVPTEDKAIKPRLAQWVARLADIAGMLETMREVLALPDADIPADDTATLAALSLLLRHAAAELQLEFAQQGEVDHAAISAAARSALTEDGQPTDLALRSGAAIRHLLIDEFQDTSLEQFELLRALSAGWESGDGRSLFAVGDPMQSIYQFREAEVGLFLRARDQGIGNLTLETLELRRNFRSAPQLIDWVNAHCARIFPPADDLRLAAIRYLPALAAREQLQGRIELHALEDNDAQREAARVLQIVRAARLRKSDASIAVLVAARRHAEPIAAALQAAGIAVRGVKLEPLRERSAVRDLCALARAIQHRADRSAWLALLHAPCCGLDLEDLQRLCEDPAGSATVPVADLIADESIVGKLAPAARARLARVRRALQPALEGAERSLPLWQRVDHAWLRLGGPATCTDARQLDDAQAFLLALSQQRDAAWLAGDAFDRFADELYAVAPSLPGAVEILTMHGAKGLEWDVVIVPGLSRGTRSGRDPLLHWVDLPAAGSDSLLLLAPINDAAQAPQRSLASWIKRLRSQRLRLERARLLYVAATRAKLELHWLGTAPLNPQGERAPRGGTALALLWPALGAQFASLYGSAEAGASAAASADVSASARVTAPQALRLSADWQATHLPAGVRVESLPLSLHEAAAVPEYSWVGLAARATGTIVHAELQRLAAGALLPAAVDRSAEDYHGWLTELGVTSDELPLAASRIVTALSRTLTDARGRWLLRGVPGHAAHSELRLTGRYEGRVINIIIDRLLHDEQGDRWIVDYKTSTHEGADLQNFLAQEALRYQPQLQRYAALLREPGGEPLRAALYFPLLGEFREVSLQAR
jgi:ATP-dependent exoDNAse (exonuclease V) beta subunit